MNACVSGLLAADRNVPQRDVVLDDRAIARRFSKTLGIGHVERCERLRVKYRVGEHVRALYLVRAGGRTELVAARTFAPERASAAYERATAAVAAGAVALDDALDAVYWTFPSDRKIARVGALAAPTPHLVRALGSAWVRTRLVAYAPEKCVTARCLGETGRTLAYAKTYADDDGLRAFELYRALGAVLPEGSPATLPRAIAYASEARTLFLEPLEGARVTDLRGAPRERAFRRLGAAIATLHGAALPSALPKLSRLSSHSVERAAEIVGRARPDVAGAALRLADRLRATAPEAEPDVCLHGDVHPKNAVLLASGVGLVDIDQAGRGPAAADLGSALAALRFARLTGAIGGYDERALRAAFLSGYASVRALPGAASLDWHTAAALLVERALRSVNRVREAGLRRLPVVLADAGDLLVEERLHRADGLGPRASRPPARDFHDLRARRPRSQADCVEGDPQ